VKSKKRQNIAYFTYDIIKNGINWCRFFNFLFFLDKSFPKNDYICTCSLNKAEALWVEVEG
jgi:hypothetical protein